MSPFSSRIRDEVLASFPQWKDLATTERGQQGEAHFVLAVSPPPEADALPLRIRTWDDGVIVEFDHYHTHFDRWVPEPADTRHRSAFLFVASLLGEQFAVASWWQEEHLALCSQYEPGAPLEPPFKVAYSAVRVRSWKGSHNVERVA